MPDEKTIRVLEDVGAALREQPSAAREVMRQVTRLRAAPPDRAARPRSNRRNWAALAGLAACAAFIFTFLVLRGDGASQAFAQAIERVAKAHTFSCREISQSVGPDGKLRVHELSYAFKEPDRERLEFVSGFDPNGEVTITDYGRRQRLLLQPATNTADLTDIRTMYDVDEKTGVLKTAQLNTRVRDDVMKLTAEAVKDLGLSQLDGKPVRVLQSTGKESVRTVYVDSQTHQPVQITVERVADKRTKYTYASIKIDATLDESLFSLETPAGYKRTSDQPHVPVQEHFAQMTTKMRALLMACNEYANDHNDQFPADLSELTKTGMTEKAMKTLLAAEGQPEGPPVIVYRRPAAVSKDPGAEVVFYEAKGQRQGGKVAVGMRDGHGEVITEAELEALLK